LKVLVDTHALLWWMGGDARLSELALGILEDGANQRLVSIVSLWEIAIKISLGRLANLRAQCHPHRGAMREQDFVMIPVASGRPGSH